MLQFHRHATPISKARCNSSSPLISNYDFDLHEIPRTDESWLRSSTSVNNLRLDVNTFQSCRTDVEHPVIANIRPLLKGDSYPVDVE